MFARQLRGLSYSYWIVRNELCSFWWTTKPFVPGKCSYLWSYCWTISLPVQSPRSLRCYQVLLRQEASRPRWKQGCTLCPCARVILWSYCQRTNPRWECACPPRLTPSTGRLRILLNRIPSPCVRWRAWRSYPIAGPTDDMFCPQKRWPGKYSCDEISHSPHLGGALQISSREKYTQSSRVGPCGHGNLSQSSGIADWCPGPTRESYDLCMRLRWCTNEDSTGELMKNGKKAKHNWYKRTNRYHQFKEV